MLGHARAVLAGQNYVINMHFALASRRRGGLAEALYTMQIVRGRRHKAARRDEDTPLVWLQQAGLPLEERRGRPAEGEAARQQRHSERRTDGPAAPLRLPAPTRPPEPLLKGF